jgi:hypothetical protein
VKENLRLKQALLGFGQGYFAGNTLPRAKLQHFSAFSRNRLDKVGLHHRRVERSTSENREGVA